MSINIDCFRLAVLVLLGGILGAAVHIVYLLVGKGAKHEATAREVDPYFDGVIEVAKDEAAKIVEIVEFKPTQRFDIDVTFDEIVGSDVQRRINAEREEKLEIEKKKRAIREKIAPIREAFEHLIKTRKPVVVGGKALELQPDWGTPRVAFFMGDLITAPRCVHVDWMPEKGYSVSRRRITHLPDWDKPNPTVVEVLCDDWRSAFDRALEFIAPHVVGYDGKTNLEVKA